MTDTIERMARAICKSDLTFDGFDVSTETVDVKFREDMAFYLSAARAALSALEEPSEAMVRAGERGIWAATMPDEPMHGGACRDVARSAFLHMIKAAKGGEG